MLYNNLSNRQAPSLLFRVDNFLVKPRKENLKDRILNKIVGEPKRSQIDRRVSGVIRNMFVHTDYTVGLIVMKSEWVKYSKELQTKLISLPITDIYLANDHFDICSKLINREYIYYVDDDTEQHSLVGHHACINLEEMTHFIKGGYKYEY